MTAGDPRARSGRETDAQYAGRLQLIRAIERVQRERRAGEGWVDGLTRLLGISEEFAIAVARGAVIATRSERNRDYAIQDAYVAGIVLGLAFARDGDEP